jgi:hypothetical protein
MPISQKVIDIGSFHKKHINKLKDSNGSNFRSIGIGKKVTGGHFTNIDSVVFHVKEKKPISKLKPYEIIPDKVIIEDKEYVTDVVHCPDRIVTLDCYGTNLESWAFDHKKRFRYYPGDQDSEKRINQGIQGGVSLGQQEGGTGTLGCVVEDLSDTGKLCGLSNNHVLVKDAFYASEKSFLPELGYTIKANNIYKKGAVQPGEPLAMDVSFTPPAFDSQYGIGYVKRYDPMYFWNWNEEGEFVYKNLTDAALCSTLKHTIDTTYNPGSGGENPDDGLETKNVYVLSSDSSKQYDPLFLALFQQHYEFASSSEISNIVPGTRIWKSGRTTGLVGHNICPACIYETNVDVNVYGYNFSQFLVEVLFSDVFSFTYASLDTDENGLHTPNPLPAVILGGDSGSVLLAEFEGVKKIIGLNFAGGSFSRTSGPGSLGFACRIDHVAEALEINSFNTENINLENNGYYGDFNTWKYIVIKGLSNQSKIDEGLDGTYYQCGTV